MRLSVCLLLVILALACYEANAVLCPALASGMVGFLFAEKKILKLELAKFEAPKKDVAAKLEVKKCTDQMSFGNRMEIEKILGAKKEKSRGPGRQ
nr:secretoglobin family 1D member 1 [Microcebus murinus]